MPSSLIHNSDYVPNMSSRPNPLRSRTSSLLPIPTRRDTSLGPSLRSISSSQPNQSPAAGRTRGISTPQRPPLYSSQYSGSSVRTATRLPSRQPSLSSSHTPLKPTTPSLKRTPSSPSPSKSSAGPKKPADKVNEDQAIHFRDLTRSFSQVPRKTPPISTTSITPDKPFPFPTPLATPLRVQRSGSRRPVVSNALPPAPASQHPPIKPSAIIVHKTSTVRSFQGSKKQRSATGSATGTVSRAIKQFSPRLNKENASPESLQSKITLTDGGSSIRTQLDYSYHPSGSSSPDLSSQVPVPALGSNIPRWPADAHTSPQVLLPSPVGSVHHEPQGFQSRTYTLEKLQSLVGMDELQRLVNPDALYQLISRSGLYETQQKIQERVFKESASKNTPDGQKQRALALTPLAFDLPQARLIPAVPRATLQATAHPSPPSAEPLLSKSSSTPPIEAASAGLEPGPKKSNYVGNILLEKLGWKSKSSNTQNSKHGTAKSISKSLRPSSFTLASSSLKGKLPGQQGHSSKSSTSEQRRFSQILGAKLETMNGSTCVVLMGERYHVLPILPFNVIEEIYRRGMQVPGIMRISGDLDRIDELVNKFESCPKTGVVLSGEDIHTLCGLLKHYLRTLPDPLFHPLLSHILWQLCVEPSRTRQADPTPDENSLQLLVARYLLQLLPSRSLSLLTYVIRFLAQIPFFAENRIQHNSLAVMLGPAIFVPREIGLPGLGLHPRRAAGQAPSTIAQAIPWRPSTHSSVSFIEDVDKNAVSQRAAESTLWLMNHSNTLFSGVGKLRDSVLLSPQHAPEATPHQFFPGQFTDTTAPEQLTQSPPTSPSTSILTYASDLSVSQRSTIHEESPELLPSSPIQPHQSPLSEANKLDEFGYRYRKSSDLLDKPENRPENSPDAGLGLAFPARGSTSNDMMEGGAAYQSAVMTRLEETAEEDEYRERKNSANVIGLLTHYMEGREKKITKQEILIESLVVEIGRLQTVPPVAPDISSKYTDYHEQMFNPSPTAEHASFELPEGCSSGTAKREVPDERSEESESLSSGSTALDPANPDPSQTHDRRRRSKNRLFGDSQGHAEDDTVEELRVSTMSPAMDPAALPRQIRRSPLTPQAWAEHAEHDPFLAGQTDEDYDSDRSNATSLRSEISRLRSLNSSLTRKLKSIETIIGDVSFR